MTKFIVLTTQRSGSSYLCSLLDNHPGISCTQEVFLPRNTNEITYRTWRTASIGRELKHWFKRQDAVNAYLAQLYGKQPSLQAFGFKLMYGQAKRYPEVVDWCGRNNVRVVHLIRQNALKMVVSRHVAQKRGVYLSTRTMDPVTVSIDTRRLIHQLQQSDRLVQRHRELFSDLPCLEVSYEAMMADRDRQLQDILTFLDCEVNLHLSTELVKTSSDSLASLIENYDEVCQALIGSRFEKYLESELPR